MIARGRRRGRRPAWQTVLRSDTLTGLTMAGQPYEEATTTLLVRFSVEETAVAIFLADNKTIAIIRANFRVRKKLM